MCSDKVTKGTPIKGPFHVEQRLKLWEKDASCSSDSCSGLCKGNQSKIYGQDREESISCSYFDGFCLPTTCGYQFLHKEGTEQLSMQQYFSFDGLGLAMPLVDGMTHHFLGAAFSHQTCLCTGFRENGTVQLSNIRDSFLLFAWGRSGGSKQVYAVHKSREQN